MILTSHTRPEPNISAIEHNRCTCLGHNGLASSITYGQVILSMLRA